MADMDELKRMIIDLSSTVSSVAIRLTEISAKQTEHDARFDRLDKKIEATEDRLSQRLTVIERKVDDTRTELEITRANLADIIREHTRRA